ncbi:MAG: hypothetical protein ACE5HU_08215, partial [Acidobacteriota bacterium]
RGGRHESRADPRAVARPGRRGDRRGTHALAVTVTGESDPYPLRAPRAVLTGFRGCAQDGCRAPPAGVVFDRSERLEAQVAAW